MNRQQISRSLAIEVDQPLLNVCTDDVHGESVRVSHGEEVMLANAGSGEESRKKPFDQAS